MSREKEKREKRMLIPCGYGDTGALEQWLEEQAAQGWRVILLGTWFAVFQAADPAPCRVRLEPCAGGEEKKETRKALYREMGWTCRAEWGDYLVFYCDDPQAPELQTDPTAQGWAWERTLRRQRLDSVLWAVWLLVCAARTLLRWDVRGRPVEWILFRGGGELVLLLPLLAWALVRAWRQFRRADLARRQLSAGVTPPHTGDWRRSLRRRRVELPVFTAIAVFTVLCMCGGETGLPEPILWAEEPLPYVAAADLGLSLDEGGGWYLRQRGLLAERVEVTEYIGGGGELRTVCTRTVLLAKPLYRETLDGLLRDRPAAAVTELAAPGLDRAVLAADRDGEVLLARRGSAVVEVRAAGAAGLADHLDQYAALLGA